MLNAMDTSLDVESEREMKRDSPLSELSLVYHKVRIMNVYIQYTRDITVELR
jgi:hypothetical protein